MNVIVQEEEITLMKRLDSLRAKHKELDDAIDSLVPGALVNEFEMRRLKKEKLTLRDQITRIEAIVYPDIIA